MRSGGMVQDGFRYWAFISYSHDDRSWARWLHRRLETYRVPRRLVGRPGPAGPRPRRLYPVFRDRDELPGSADLGGVVHRALRDSRYLIVICSRHAARSRWVNEEVETFKKLGREDRVLCLKIDESDEPSGCFTPALLQRYDAGGRPTGRASEPLAADIAPDADGRDGAALKLIAGMLGVGYDDLRRRERRRRLRWHLALIAGSLALLVAAFAGWRWQQDEKRQALDAQARGVRLARLYESGREALLAHDESRAAVYLNEVYREGVDTPALRYLLARAMRIVDAQKLRIDLRQTVIDVGIDRDATLAYALGADHVLQGFDLTRGGVALFKVPLGDMGRWLAGYSPGGTLISIDRQEPGAARRRLQLFDARSGALRAQFEPASNVSNVFTPTVADDDRHVVFVADDGAVVVAGLSPGEAGAVQRRVPGRYSAAGFCGDGRSFIAGRSDGDVELRDVASGALRRRFTGAGGELSILASARGCTVVAAGTLAGGVRVWDVGSGAVLMSAGHRRAVSDLQFSDDGARLLSVSRGAAAIWNGRSGALVYASRYFGGAGDLVMLRPDGRQFGQMIEGRLAMLDAASGLESYTLDGHLGAPTGFRFAAASPRLISGGADGSVVVWSLPDGTRAELGSAPPGKAPAAAFSPDGRLLFVGQASGGGALWQRASLRRLRDIAATQGFVSSAAFSPDGRWLATGSADDGVRVSEVDGGRVVWHFATPGRPISLQFDAKARFLSAESADASFRLWDLLDGSERLAEGQIEASALAPRGASLALGAHGRVRVLDVERGRERWSVNLAPSSEGLEFASAAFSADGRRLLITARHGHAYVLDAADGHIVNELHDPSAAYFTTGAFDADARQVVLGDWSKSARLWRLADDRVLTLGGHTGAVEAASFSPDGRFVLSAGDDGSIKLWDAGNGELLDSFVAHDGLIQWRAASFAPDGADILSSGRDGVARLWPVRSETRDPASIAAALHCRVAWQVAGNGLVPHEIDTLRCRRPGADGEP
ncbi:MAG: TIR domain-containing protein [Solimonas sp.]